MRLLFLLPGLLLLNSLLAQNGDRPGEVQVPLPKHIKVPPSPTLTAEEEMQTFHVAPGFHLELVAAEPLIHNPVAMTFGPDGRIWVVEMSAFMPNTDGKGEDAKVGSVVVLEDTDGDGRMDKRTVFATGLVMPRALALAGSGVLVAEPPHLWYFRDRDGDGVVEEKTEIAADYGSPINPEHTANGLFRALDNWIYSANHTTRFRFDGEGRFTREPTVTRGQWGMTQDDTGRLFHNSNSDPLRGDVVPSEYFRRNPYLTAPAGSSVAIVPFNLRIWPGRPTTGVNRGYNSLDAEGKITAVTAACAPVIYRGALFPAEFNGNAFVCEPSGNLLKRIVLTEHDGTITGHNAYEGTEFLTSTDERFRPVNLANGPDGALYLVDMYHGIIQHRVYMTSYLRQQVEERHLQDGAGMGRIYRIVPDTAKLPHKVRFDLARETPEKLVSHLSAANSWWRDTAQRLLVEGRDPAATAPLRALARSTTASALGRLHALWTLEGLGQLDRDTTLTALASGDDRVVAAGIRLAEKWLAKPDDAEIFRRVVATDNHASPRVILQEALSLGEADSPQSLDALARLAREHGDQLFVADAIVSGITGREVAFISQLVAPSDSGHAATTLTLATSSALKPNDATKTTAVLSLLGPSAPTPAWARDALFAGVERYLPKTPEGKPVPTLLPVEPTPLLALAHGDAPENQRAAKLVALLKWPGKPGLAEETAAIAARMTPQQKVLFEKGRVQFAAICAACHQPNGEGLSGLAPQLLYSRFVLGPDRVISRIVLCGKESDGVVMPALRTLDDETIASILTFIRQSWGHNAPPVAVATVAAVRHEIAGREEPWTDDEMQKLLQREKARQNASENPRPKS